MADWRAKQAINQTIFREMNEWTEDDNDSREGLEPRMDTYLCECGDASCTVPIRLTRSEYEAIRSEPTRFALALNHENPEIDTLIAENERFATIEKSFGKLRGSPVRLIRAASARPLDEVGPRACSPGPGTSLQSVSISNETPLSPSIEKPSTTPVGFQVLGPYPVAFLLNIHGSVGFSSRPGRRPGSSHARHPRGQGNHTAGSPCGAGFRCAQ